MNSVDYLVRRAYRLRINLMNTQYMAVKKIYDKNIPVVSIGNSRVGMNILCKLMQDSNDQKT